MDYTTILVNKEERGVGVITLNRPDVHNAFDDVFIRELTFALDDMHNDNQMQLVMLKSTGKSFSAGADLNWMAAMAANGWNENFQDSLALATLMQTLANMNKPTIAVVQGSAFGGGVGLVACCDIVLAADKAQFCLSEVKLGLIPAVISPYVVRAIGARAAGRYFITAERFSAQQAWQHGLVHELFRTEQLDESAEKVVLAILGNSPKAIIEARNLIRKVADKPIDEDLVRHTARKIADMRASVEGREGVTAFLEKRTPDWNKKYSTDLGD